MISKDDALQFIKDNHNGEIPYTFGKNEYARWMAEFANHILSERFKPMERVTGKRTWYKALINGKWKIVKND